MSTEEEAPQTLVEHLSDLRKCLLRSVIGIVIGFSICWIFSEQLFNIIRQPIAPFLKEGGLIFTAPMDKFLAHIKVSLLASIIISCPYWIYQIWIFIAPGLYEKEKKYGVAFIFSGFVFEQIIFAPKRMDFPTYKWLCQVSQFIGINDTTFCAAEFPFKVQSRTMGGQFSADIWTSIFGQ